MNTGDDKKLAELELEERMLRLEDLRNRVTADRERRANIQLAHERQARSLEDYNQQVKKQQDVCKHRKGGKGLEGILNGHDSNYSVAKHQYPWGEFGVMCLRCGKEWRKPKDELKKENPAAYKAAMSDYKEALNFPTDNEGSGTQLFMVERVGKKSAAEATA